MLVGASAGTVVGNARGANAKAAAMSVTATEASAIASRLRAGGPAATATGLPVEGYGLRREG
jgi:hypothetical protein